MRGRRRRAQVESPRDSRARPLADRKRHERRDEGESDERGPRRQEDEVLQAAPSAQNPVPSARAGAVGLRGFSLLRGLRSVGRDGRGRLFVAAPSPAGAPRGRASRRRWPGPRVPRARMRRGRSSARCLRCGPALEAASVRMTPSTTSTADLIAVARERAAESFEVLDRLEPRPGLRVSRARDHVGEAGSVVLICPQHVAPRADPEHRLSRTLPPSRRGGRRGHEPTLPFRLLLAERPCRVSSCRGRGTRIRPRTRAGASRPRSGVSAAASSGGSAPETPAQGQEWLEDSEQHRQRDAEQDERERGRLRVAESALAPVRRRTRPRP